MAISTLLPILLAASSVLSQAAAVIHTTGSLEVTNAVVNPDGFERSAVTAGGGAIGQLITANKGDTLQINVVNNLNNGDMLEDTTIHWHGFFQAGTSWADGPAFVTQCPIIPGDSFLYDFTATGQAGTFWYHSHLSTQYCDGLKGPIVVYDPEDPYLNDYDVDDETTVWTLSDWYHSFAPDLDGTFAPPDSQLFNGVGRSTSSDTTVPLGVATVTKGTRYRIRLVNVGCDADYVFSIDGHTFTVIEVDSVNHEPLEVDELQIYAGQRYSIILTANQDVDNYWIRFNPSVGDTGFTGGINSAILRYVNADEVEPTTTQTDSTNPLVQSNLVPLESPGAPGTAGVGNADINLNLALAFNSNAHFTVNGVTYTSPTVPVLLQILSGASTPSSLLESDSIYSLGLNKVVELSIPGGVVGGEHPFHLHGHTFDVVRSAGSDTYNYVNPPRRDVVSIGGAGDNVTIRFTTDNAGPWFLHCHIDWHLEVGLAIVFAEEAADWSEESVPTAWSDLCPTYNDSLSRRSSISAA